MKITVYRPNQIGGCITEIESSKGSRIIIDVGSNLPGTESCTVDIKALTKGCDAVFITHYHGDHLGEFAKVDDSVPIYMGAVAHKIFLNLRKWLRDKDIETIKKFKTFVATDQIKTESGDFIVTPYRVDHSAYDSYMFLIECDGKRILHTGDFRTHGWTGKGFNKALETYIKKVDALICEGTMLSRPKGEMYTEAAMSADAIKHLRRNKHVFVLCSSTNIDSIASFYQAAEQANRLFVTDVYQKTNLDIITKSAGIDKRQSRLYNFERKKIYTYNDSDKHYKLHDYMNNQGFCMLIRPIPFHKNPLFENALKRFPNNLIIYSLWDGYLEEGKPYANPDYIEFRNRAIENGSKFIPLHTSGHAYEEAIIDLCNIIRPDTILPIHSEEPGRFEELRQSDDIKQGVVKRFQGEKDTITI